MTRIGLVGLGAMGRNHLRVLEDLDGVELAAVCDLDASTANEVARRHSVHAYGSWDEMLVREKLDAVVVAVPTGLHLEAGLAVLRRGAHVLIEKPIAAGLEEGRRLVAEARRAGRVLAVGHIERFNPAVRELQRRVRAGDIGRLFQLQARRLGPFPARIRDVGVVIDLATHDLDVMDHLAGSEVQRVFAETEQRIHTDHEDLFNGVMKFANGVIGVLDINWLTPNKRRTLTVTGERGMYVADYIKQDLIFYSNPDAVQTWENPGADDSDQLTTSVSEGEMTQRSVRRQGLRALHLALALVTSASESRMLVRDDLRRMWRAGRADGDDL